MEALRGVKLTLLGTAAVFALTTTGCATKKHVAKVVAPIEGRVTDSEKKLAENQSAINELEGGVTRADERAMDADKKAVAAGQEASRANERAGQAGQRADEARSLAERGLSKIGDVENSVNSVQNTIQNLDTFKMVAEDSVLFRFGRSVLDQAAKDKLDQAVSQVQGMRAYVIEVHGFTDRVGNKDYNLELSRKRANEVVRYLTVNHNIPLRRIHVIGLGSEKPADEAKTRAANAANRRVEVKVYAPEYAVAGMANQPASQTAPARTTPQANQ